MLSGPVFGTGLSRSGPRLHREGSPRNQRGSSPNQRQLPARTLARSFQPEEEASQRARSPEGGQLGGGADQTGSKGAWQRRRRGSIAGPRPNTQNHLYTSSSHPICDAQHGRACGLNLIVASDTLPTSQTQRWKNCQGVFVRTGLVPNRNWTRTFQRVRDGGTAPKGRRSPLKSSGIQGLRASSPVTRSLVHSPPLWGGC